MRTDGREPLSGARRLLVIVGLSFVAGVLADIGLTWRRQPAAPAPAPITTGPARDAAPGTGGAAGRLTRPARPGGPAAPVGTSGSTPAAGAETLAPRSLAMPVVGVTRSDLRDTFTDARGANRAHDAIDIMAPRRTPVVAADDGTIVKLFSSQAGGLTIYQFDPSQSFGFYYAHLDGYAADVAEGQAVRRGQVIGYVGSTGNASAEAPHLHFAVFRLTPARQWWRGDAINPYPLLR